MEKIGKYVVYKIIIDGRVRYIGHTDDIVRREKQHNYLLFKAGAKKILYDKIRKHYPNLETISLLEIGRFKSRIDAKRLECFYILKDYFSTKVLWQRVPKISDM